MKAIETQYGRFRFRTQLEARWAVFFDALGIDWEYQNAGYDVGAREWCPPAFFVHMAPNHPTRRQYPGAGYWVEIKALPPTLDEYQKLQRYCQETKHHAYLMVGAPADNVPIPISMDPPRPPAATDEIEVMLPSGARGDAFELLFWAACVSDTIPSAENFDRDDLRGAVRSAHSALLLLVPVQAGK